jgi:hypothetical protein
MNPGRVPLEIIEVQSGPYLGEDDIVRIDDIYGRTGTDRARGGAPAAPAAALPGPELPPKGAGGKA